MLCYQCGQLHSFFSSFICSLFALFHSIIVVSFFLYIFSLLNWSKSLLPQWPWSKSILKKGEYFVEISLLKIKLVWTNRCAFNHLGAHKHMHCFVDMCFFVRIEVNFVILLNINSYLARSKNDRCFSNFIRMPNYVAIKIENRFLSI